MENKQIHLNVSPGDDKEKPVVIHLLEGEAPKPLDYTSFSITGNINAVKDFLVTRLQEVLKHKDAHILLCEKDAAITLVMYEMLHYRSTVKGALVQYPELAAFGINTTKQFSLIEIRSLIKMSRIFFSDKDKHLELVSALQNFTAKVESTHTDIRDNRANKNVGQTKQVETGLMADFTLQMPLFNGTPVKKFRVEICYDVTDGGTKFWFESVELFELNKTAVLDALEEQKKEFVAAGLTVVSQ